MPVLGIFLFGVLAFIAVLMGLIVAHILECQTREQLRDEAPGEPFSVLAVALAFDPDHALVWETQVPMLQLMARSGRQGASLRRLHLAYLASATHYPELYDGSTFQQWLQFLQQAGLIVFKDQRATLTNEGQEFLHYRVCAQPERVLRSASATAINMPDDSLGRTVEPSALKR